LTELVIASLVAALLVTWLMERASRTWYTSAAKPSGTPDPASLKILWVSLHFLLGVAAWEVWLQRGWGGAPAAYEFFFAQLALSVLWAAFFFGLRRPALAFSAIIALWLSAFGADLAFWKISGLAGFLELIYLAWITYMMLLNVRFWRLHRGSEQPEA
jgi:translocator protein